MPEEKGIGSKFLGLFVETDSKATEGEPPRSGSKSAADEIAELARASGAPPSPPGPAAAPAPAGPPLKLSPAAAPPAGPIDFNAIFREAGMDPAELDRATKAEDLLTKLPSSIGQAEKRAIVEASLKAFGFEIERIVSAAQNQKRALDAYVKVNETATARATQEAEAKIKALNEQIAQLRADVDRRGVGLQQLSAQAQARKAQVEKVLEFFSAPPPAPPAGPAKT
ncbi:MAG TPA: hypothetical protein VND93_03465 [Myxococcales bacterium]|nr:hypothetical protein [Myxococcales bacterium]